MRLTSKNGKEWISKSIDKLHNYLDRAPVLVSDIVGTENCKDGVFIMSSTQLNGDYQESETPEQNLLRGAKAIADKIDFGSILLNTTTTDLESLNTLLVKNGLQKPNEKLSIYKNRRGRYKGIYLWCKSELGTCRVIPLFATTWNYELVPMEDIKIITEEENAF